MNAEEPITSIGINQSVGGTGKPLPEQSKQSVCNIPRPINFYSIINQWQPLGCRIVLNLPFTGDDSNYLFAIRNGPFSPDYHKEYYGDSEVSPNTFKDLLNSYALNNTAPVVLPASVNLNFPEKPQIFLTYYDKPPPIATMAQAFRRWRGDMQYRIRVIAGFATQGYVMASTLKNVFSPIGIYNEYKKFTYLQTQDDSYREAMMNSYVLSDTSMFRHLELTMPYDYPTPYYDQMAWLTRRVNPALYFDKADDGKITVKPGAIQTEPHGDNWLVFGLRGNLAATQAGAQILFEIEYRCVEGFQFADPFVLPGQFQRSIRRATKDDYPDPLLLERRFPDNSMESDGLGIPKKKDNSIEGPDEGVNGQPTSTTMTAATRMAASPTRAPYIPPEQYRRPNTMAHARHQGRAGTRFPRTKRAVDGLNSMGTRLLGLDLGSSSRQ